MPKNLEVQKKSEVWNSKSVIVPLMNDTKPKTGTYLIETYCCKTYLEDNRPRVQPIENHLDLKVTGKTYNLPHNLKCHQALMKHTPNQGFCFSPTC